MTSQPVTVGAPGADGYGCGAVGHRELVAGAETCDVADLGEQLGGGQLGDARDGDQRPVQRATALADVVGEHVDLAGQLLEAGHA